MQKYFITLLLLLLLCVDFLLYCLIFSLINIMRVCVYLFAFNFSICFCSLFLFHVSCLLHFSKIGDRSILVQHNLMDESQCCLLAYYYSLVFMTIIEIKMININFIIINLLQLDVTILIIIIIIIIIIVVVVIVVIIPFLLLLFAGGIQLKLP